MNALMCFWFSVTYDLILLYASRIVMGMTQAFCCIYAPVWVNEYSPPNRGATWMGMLQAFSPIGKEKRF
jgi:MFS family permease